MAAPQFARGPAPEGFPVECFTGTCNHCMGTGPFELTASVKMSRFKLAPFFGESNPGDIHAGNSRYVNA